MSILYSAIDFGNTDDDVYDAWAEAPVFARSGIALLILLAVAGLLCLRRWRPRTRTALLCVAILCATAIDGTGIYETYARHHIRPELMRALETVPTPSGAVADGPVTVSGDGGDPLNGVPAEPVAQETWKVAGGFTTACAAIGKAVTDQPGWTKLGGIECEYRRVRGRVLLAIRIGDPNGSVVSALAWPNDEG